MSRRKSPDPLGSNTRQMLDELDVLMEKMLALPVNHLEEGAGMTSAPAAVATQLTVHEPPEQRGQAPARTPSTSEPGSAQVLVGQLAILHSPTAHEVLPSPKSASRDDRAAALARAATSSLEDAWTSSSEFLPPLASLSPTAAETRLPVARRFSFRFRPLLWLNQGFDLFTQRLGLPGSWLRHSSGRMVIGMLGLLLLALALGWWLKEWMGWTWSWESLE